MKKVLFAALIVAGTLTLPSCSGEKKGDSTLTGDSAATKIDDAPGAAVTRIDSAVNGTTNSVDSTAGAMKDSLRK